MAKVAEVLVQTLIEAGVKRVYGVAGDSLNGMTETIRKSDKIEWLHVRHEEVAAFAAGAEAHLTNEIAVCAGLGFGLYMIRAVMNGRGDEVIDLARTNIFR